MRMYNQSVLMMAAETATAGKAGSESTTLRDLSLKSMGSEGKLAVKEEKRVFMGRLYGEVLTMKTAEDKRGKVFTFFMGDFAGVNPKGENFTSSKLFLPGGYSDTIEAMMVKANGGAVQFGIDVWSEPAKTTLGFQYVVKPILQTEAIPRAQEILAKLPALPKS